MCSQQNFFSRFAVWIYFTLSLIGSQAQKCEPYCNDKSEPYTFIPICLVLKFIFFFGWLEVAEAIENPFGNDADDFHICQLVRFYRHVLSMSDETHFFRGPNMY